jgi:FtsH-binding integral membrane protein
MNWKLKTPFNPYCLILFILLAVFGPVTIFLAAALNYSWMTKIELKKKMIKYAWVSFAASLIIYSIIVICVPEPVHNQIISIMAEITFYLNIVIGAFLIHKQLPDYTEWKLKNVFKQEVKI